MRVRLLIAVTAATVSLALPGAALAVGTGGSGSGGNNGGTMTGGGGSASTSGVRWFDLANTDTADFPFGGLAGDLNSAKRKQAAGDTGAYAVSKKISRLFQDACSGGRGTCLLWRDQRNRRDAGADTWYEVHTTHPDNNKPAVTAGVTVGFNIKVWRENPDAQRFDLIFERRVGTGRGDSDPHHGPLGQDVHRQWWYGSKTLDRNGERMRLYGGGLQRAGGTYSNAGMTSAGMIGDGSRADQNNCRDNYRDGSNGQRRVDGRKVKSFARPNSMPKGSQWCYWEGQDLGPERFRWGAPSGTRQMERDWRGGTRGLPNDEFGGEDSSKQDLGAGGKGLKEAIFVKWNLPLNPNGSNSFEYKIDGAPGLYYIVQVVALDTREEIQPLRGAQSYFQDNQMLKAYIANPQPAPNREQFTCGTASTGCEKPDLAINLDATSPAQTREVTTQTLETSTLDQINNLQAVFPIESDLIHFTPQMKYSSPAAATGGSPQATYPGSYISYGSERDGNVVARRDSPFSPPAAITGGRETDLQETHLKKAAYLAPLSDGDALTTDPLSSDEDLPYEMTWLKPTLSNPCQAEARLPERSDPPTWPASPQRCGPTQHGWPQRFDAWDDLLQARLTWESVWVDSIVDPEKDPEKEYGYIQNQPLRCASAPGVSEIYPRNRCGDERFELLDSAIGQGTQHAQGFLLAANSEGSRTSVPVRFALRTNRPQNVTNAYLYERGGEMIDSRQRSIDPTRAALQTNTVSGDIELNYCRQGLPEGANLYRPGRRDRPVAGGETGDPDCQGPAVRWRWDAASCSRQPVPAAGSFPRPTLAAVRDAARGGEELPAGGEYRQALKAGQSRAYDPEADFAGAPYDGQRPSPGSSPDCGVSGHLQTGRWVLSRQAGPGWGSNNTAARINLHEASVSGMPLIVDYEFNSTDSELATGTWWRLRGSYNGFTNYRWVSRIETKGGRTDDGSSAYVRVYGPRNSR